MGEQADYIIEQLMSSYSPPPRRPSFQSGTGNYKWRQAGGAVLDMHEMSTRHLKNALNHAESYGNTGKAKQLREVLQHRENWNVFSDDS